MLPSVIEILEIVEIIITNVRFQQIVQTLHCFTLHEKADPPRLRVYRWDLSVDGMTKELNESLKCVTLNLKNKVCPVTKGL